MLQLKQWEKNLVQAPHKFLLAQGVILFIFFAWVVPPKHVLQEEVPVSTFQVASTMPVEDTQQLETVILEQTLELEKMTAIQNQTDTYVLAIENELQRIKTSFETYQKEVQELIGSKDAKK